MVTAAGRRASQGDVEVLAELAAIRLEVDAAMLEAVRGLRAAGYTWKDIGAATGTTGQAATMKWLPKLDVTAA